MAGELADDGGVGAGVGEVGAEGVTQHVWSAMVLGQPGSLAVARDDSRDVAGAQRSRGLAGARQREQQVFDGGNRADLDSRGDRGETVLIERDPASTPALAVADRDPPGRLCECAGRVPRRARAATRARRPPRRGGDARRIGAHPRGRNRPYNDRALDSPNVERLRRSSAKQCHPRVPENRHVPECRFPDVRCSRIPMARRSRPPLGRILGTFAWL